MDGIQKTAYLALMRLAEKVAESAYGTGDDFAVDALADDLEDELEQLQ